MEPKKMSTLIMAKTKPEGGIEEEMQDDGGDGLEAAASDLLSAIEAKDPKAIAEAWRAGHDICAYGCDEQDEASEGGV